MRFIPDPSWGSTPFIIRVLRNICTSMHRYGCLLQSRTQQQNQDFSAIICHLQVKICKKYSLKSSKLGKNVKSFIILSVWLVVYFLSMLCESVWSRFCTGHFYVWLQTVNVPGAVSGSHLQQQLVAACVGRYFACELLGGGCWSLGAGAWDGNIRSCPRILWWPGQLTWAGQAAAAIKTVIRCWGQRWGALTCSLLWSEDTRHPQHQAGRPYFSMQYESMNGFNVSTE